MSEDSKRLRLSEADLEITCILEEDDEKQNTSSLSSKTYMRHSVVMATRSQFIDNLLTTEMKEKEEMKLTLHVSPSTFELAMLLLEDPSEANSATPEQVLQVAPFYDQYAFDGGIKLVVSVLSKFLDEWTTDERANQTPKLIEMERIVGAIAFSHSSNIDSLVEKSKTFWSQRIGSSIWSPNYIRQIQDFIIKRCAIINHHFMFKFFRHEDTGDSFEDEGEGVSKLFQEYLGDSEFPDYLFRKFCIKNHAFDITDFSCKIKLYVSFEFNNGQHWYPDHDYTMDLNLIQFQRDTEELNYWGNGLTFVEYDELNGGPPSSNNGLLLRRLERCPNSKFIREKEFMQGMDSGFGELFQSDDWVMELKWRHDTYYFAAPMSRNSLLPPKDSSSWVALNDEVDISDAHENNLARRLRVRLEYVRS